MEESLQDGFNLHEVRGGGGAGVWGSDGWMGWGCKCQNGSELEGTGARMGGGEQGGGARMVGVNQGACCRCGARMGGRRHGARKGLGAC